MNKTDDFKVYTFEEVLDDIYGVDTPERKRFEKYCDEEMRKEEERISFRVFRCCKTNS